MVQGGVREQFHATKLRAQEAEDGRHTSRLEVLAYDGDTDGVSGVIGDNASDDRSAALHLMKNNGCECNPIDRLVALSIRFPHWALGKTCKSTMRVQTFLLIIDKNRRRVSCR